MRRKTLPVCRCGQCGGAYVCDSVHLPGLVTPSAGTQVGGFGFGAPLVYLQTFPRLWISSRFRRSILPHRPLSCIHRTFSGEKKEFCYAGAVCPSLKSLRACFQPSVDEAMPPWREDPHGFLGIHVCHAGLSRMVATAHMVRNESPRSCWVVLPSISTPQPNSSVVSGSGTCKDAVLPLSRSHPRILAARACQEQTHGWPYGRSGTRHRN